MNRIISFAFLFFCFVFFTQAQNMTSEAKLKIAENLKNNLPRLNGITKLVTIKINSENEADNATHFLNKFSSLFQEKFGFYDVKSHNSKGVAKFEMKIDKEYTLPDLKIFVTQMGYRFIDVSDCLILKN